MVQEETGCSRKRGQGTTSGHKRTKNEGSEVKTSYGNVHSYQNRDPRGVSSHEARPGALPAETLLLGARVRHWEALRFLVGRLGVALQVVQATVTDRNGDTALTATAFTFTLAVNRSPCRVSAGAPAHMSLEGRVVDGGSSRGDTAITSRRAKRIEARMLSAQERRRARATLDGIDERIEAFASHVRLRGFVERRRGTRGAGGARSERRKGRRRGGIGRIC